MLIVGIAGGTGSGKTTVVRKVMAGFNQGEVVLLPQDSYYRDNSHLPLEARQKLNFDHPESIEWSLLIQHLRDLREQKSIRQPIYSYLTCTREPETILIHPKRVILVEGILVLTQKEVRDLLDIKVFVDADADDRLSRVIRRDLAERGRSAETVLDRYDLTVKPMHLEFIEPSKRYADLIIPQGGENRVGIRLLTSLIRQHLSE
ncbi:MAG: uridine kinase [Bacteroidales bacterium]|jgi:uridine kinase|nr:uridine kinase [Bacteroidales bacterium]MDD2570898.1 uridine kinase [Bacteroidales bacterium]MDD2812442.1 uridine kinase [Bacteroidales bacterium]MDD3385292.1 uridine kinase [Bacteroidales bacterium]MDD3811063.1 uridine kinase [Bacteroidales bacterium]